MTEIIDAHVHYLLREGEEDRLLAAMDEAGVAKSLVLAMAPLGFLGACLAGNRQVLALCRRHPDRLALGAFIDPREPDAADTLHKYADAGARAVKLFPPIGFYPDNPDCMSVYEAAAEPKLPILSHTCATNCDYWPPRKRQALASHWADPIRFDGLARQFPEITWVLAHMGFPWCLNAWYVAAGNSNVLLDISGGWFWCSSLPHLYNASGRQVPIDWDKVTWGSDNCSPPKEHIESSKKLLEEMGCPPEKFPAVFGQTASRVFGLTQADRT